MAGTLVISTLSDGTNSTSSTNCIQGSAKAWVNFNGVTTTSIRASYNVSSVTRNAAGDYTVNFTSALADANYAQNITGSWVPGVGAFAAFIDTGPASTLSAPTASSFRFTMQNHYNAGTSDVQYLAVSVFR